MNSKTPPKEKEDITIINKIEQRMNSVEKTTFNFEKKITELNKDITKQKKETRTQTENIKKELENITTNVNKLHKLVFSWGKILRYRVTKRDFENISKTLNEKPIEDFITKKELERTYNKYSNQQINK